MKTTELKNYLNDYLAINQFSDYAPNGLQVAGKDEIKTIVTGVTACQALLDEAVKLNADAILVHHGYFWKGEDPCVVGIKHNRLKTLLTHDINLFGYHLPLDAHPIVGNNKQLGDLLDFTLETTLSGAGEQPGLIWLGETQAITGLELAEKIESRLARAPLYVAGSHKPIKKVAWCTGGAQDFITAAAIAGADAYITGEASERTFHLANELGTHFYAAGHHATERYGVIALGEHLAQQFDLEVINVDIDNPI